MNVTKEPWIPARRGRARRGRPSSPLFLGEEHADGFVGEIPTWLAYCPDREAKLTFSGHEDCPFFGGQETDQRGDVIAFRCALLTPATR